MGKAGRKSKAGKRAPSGRLSRAGQVVIFDRGSQRTADKFSVYGPDGSDAVGRAYQAGLLGEEDGVNLRNRARKIHRAYWPMFAVGREKSCLGLDINGQAVNDNLIDPDERQRKIDRERLLNDSTRKIERMSRQHRKAFDELCIDINPDYGPAWLDALIWAKRHDKPSDPAHEQTLRFALEALNAVASEWG